MNELILSGSYLPEDVIFLLKNINGLIVEKNNEVREKAVQGGTHYSEMLPIEYQPTQEYMNIFLRHWSKVKPNSPNLQPCLVMKLLKKEARTLF